MHRAAVDIPSPTVKTNMAQAKLTWREIILKPEIIWTNLKNTKVGKVGIEYENQVGESGCRIREYENQVGESGCRIRKPIVRKGVCNYEPKKKSEVTAKNIANKRAFKQGQQTISTPTTVTCPTYKITKNTNKEKDSS